MGRQLARTLGLPALVVYGVGLILGAGVYSVLGAAAESAGTALWWSFALGGAVALLTGLSYAELATRFPDVGAEYRYALRAVPRAPAAATAIGLVLVLASAAMATTVARSFAGYLGVLVDTPGWPAAAALLVVVAAVAIVGLRTSTWVNVAFTAIEVGGLALVIVLAATAGDRGDAGAALHAVPGSGVLAGAALVFFAYLGFEDLANLVEETREPRRMLPRALVISVAITTVLYVAVAFAVIALVPAEHIAGSDSPLAVAAGSVSPVYTRVLAGVALFATANTALITLMAASRMVMGMARDGHVPRVLAKVSGRKTPWVATLALLAIALALLPLGGLAVVAGLSSFAALVAFAAVNASLIVIRVRERRGAGRRSNGEPDAFRVPLAIAGVPVLPALGALSSLLLVSQFSWPVVIAGAVASSAALTFALAFKPRAAHR